MIIRCLAWTVVLWRGGVLASVEDCRLAIDAGGEALDVDLNARALHLSEAITMAAAVVARMPDDTLYQPCRGADGTSNDAGAACVVRTIVDALRARRRECGLSDIFEGDDGAAPERDAGPTRKVAVVVLRGDTFRQGATAECARLEYKACSAPCDGGDRTRLVQLSAVQSVQDFLVAPLRAAGWAVHLLAYAHACGLNGVLKDALAERVDAASFDFVEVAAPTSEATAKKTQAEMAAAALRRAFSSGVAADIVVLTRFDLEFARPLLDDLSGTVWGTSLERTGSLREHLLFAWPTADDIPTVDALHVVGRRHWRTVASLVTALDSFAWAPHRGSLHPLLHASEIVARDSGLALDYVWRDAALLRVSTSSRKRPADAVAPFVECHKPTDAPQWTEICDLARLRRRVDGKEAEL